MTWDRSCHDTLSPSTASARAAAQGVIELQTAAGRTGASAGAAVAGDAAGVGAAPISGWRLCDRQ